MTRDEILHMEAGREMDALIAENIMGWRWHASPDGGDFLRPNDKFWYGVFRQPGYVAYYETLLRYSTDIAAAWEVSEKLKLGIAIGKKDVGVYFAVESDLCANVEFWWDDDPDMHCNCAYAETPALAICRAALLATMEVS